MVNFVLTRDATGCRGGRGRGGSEEAVGIDIDLQRGRRRRLDGREPGGAARLQPAPRGALTRKRRRWRPRRMASGAGAGPSTSIPVAAAARRARARAARVGRVARLGPTTISAASRPKGGSRRRGARPASAARKPSRSPRGERAHHRMLRDVASGSARGRAARRGRRGRRPGASSWKVRSAARRSPPASAEIGIDDADQRQHAGNGGPWRRSACRSRDRSRAPRIRRDELAAPRAGPRDRVAGHHRDARLGEQRGRLLGERARRPGRRRRGCRSAPQCGQVARQAARRGRNDGIAAGRRAVLDQPGACSSGIASGGRRRGTGSAARSRGG